MAELLRWSYYARNGTLAQVIGVLQSVSPAFQGRADWHEVHTLARQALGLTFVVLAREGRKDARGAQQKQQAQAK